MSYNGSGTFQINTSGQPVVAGTVISSTAFNALTADLATGLSTAITKDGQTTTTARIPFAAGINSSSATDSTNTSTGSIITSGGVGIAKALYVGTTLNVTGVATFSAAPIYSSLTASSAVATDASKALVSVTNTGTGNNVLATSPTLVTPVLGAASATSITVDAGAVGTPSITTTGDTNTGIFFPAADTIAFSEGGAEVARFDSSGNLGIGQTSNNYRLNATSASATNGVVCQLTNTGSTGAGIDFLQSGVDNFQLTMPAGAGGLRFIASGTNERMRIDSSGNLLVGTTSTVDSAKFVVLDAEGNDFAVGRLNGGNRFVGSSSIYNKTTANAANVFVNSSATAYAIVRSTSSIKYKKDVENAVHGLAEVLQLRPVTYRGKEDGEQVFGGLIAEEVHQLGLTEFVQYDENNEPDALAYGPLVSLAFKAIQEQQALIQSLTDRITALETN